MSLLLEKAWPYILSFALVLAWFFYFDRSFPGDASDLVSATGNVSAVLVGFLITAKAIVLGLTSTPLFQRLAETGYNKVFFNYMYEAEIAGILLLVVSVVGFFTMDANGQTPFAFNFIWVTLASSTIFLFFRVVTMIFTFLKQV